jgi:hypothetical protein
MVWMICPALPCAPALVMTCRLKQHAGPAAKGAAASALLSRPGAPGPLYWVPLPAAAGLGHQEALGQVEQWAAPVRVA